MSSTSEALERAILREFISRAEERNDAVEVTIAFILAVKLVLRLVEIRLGKAAVDYLLDFAAKKSKDLPPTLATELYTMLDARTIDETVANEIISGVHDILVMLRRLRTQR